MNAKKASAVPNPPFPLKTYALLLFEHVVLKALLDLAVMTFLALILYGLANTTIWITPQWVDAAEIMKFSARRLAMLYVGGLSAVTFLRFYRVFRADFLRLGMAPAPAASPEQQKE